MLGGAIQKVTIPNSRASVSVRKVFTDSQDALQLFGVLLSLLLLSLLLLRLKQ